MHRLEMHETDANGRRVTSKYKIPSGQFYSADIKGRTVTVIMKRIRSGSVEEAQLLRVSRTSIDEEADPPTDLTILKWLW